MSTRRSVPLFPTFVKAVLRDDTNVGNGTPARIVGKTDLILWLTTLRESAMVQARSKGAHEGARCPGGRPHRVFYWRRRAKVRILADRSRVVPGGAGDRSPAPCISPVIYRTDRKIDAITRFTCSGLIGRAKAAHAAWFMRSTSGATASSASALSAASSGSTLWPSLPRRRIETVRSAASLRPTTSSAGTLASECSRTL